mgnify:CR=1 FL=1
MDTERKEGQKWVTVASPGYLGSRRDATHELWDKEYGEGSWRIGWELADGTSLTYPELFRLYVDSYAQYFREHLKEAVFLAENFSYAWDETDISRAEVFDPYALWGKPGNSNQFHHVALNVAIEQVLEMPFVGRMPIQVRGGKPGTPTQDWSEGWWWHPGRIPCLRPELIPQGFEPERKWWDNGTIEDLYQKAKVLQVRLD